MDLNTINSYLTPVGTLGWFAFLISKAIRSKKWSELFVPLLFSMLIIDAWAVAPSQLNQDFDNSLLAVTGFWLAALLPYFAMLW